MPRFLAVLALAALVGSAAHAQKPGGLRAFGLSEADLAAIEPRSPDPFRAYLAAGVEPDIEYWTAKLAIDGVRRARARMARGFRSAPTATYRERERAVFARNDDLPERIPADVFGAAEDEPITQISGTFETRPPGQSARQPSLGEDGADGTLRPTRIRLAGPVAEGATTVAAEIGDGPFGRTTGDVDVYELVVAEVGTYGILEARSLGGALDPVLALYGPDGTFLVSEDDDRDARGTVISKDPKVFHFFERPGTYRLYVWGYTNGARTPGLSTRTDARSGAGVGSTGPYELFVASMTPDTDRYAVDLDRGDVLGVVSAHTASDLAVYGPSGALEMRSRTDISGSYGEGGPLLSPAEFGGTQGGITVAVVAREGGTYVVEARGQGPYALVLQKARPGHERPGAERVETLFVDFDGGRYYPQRDLGGKTADVADLTPLSAFLPRWGLSAADEDAVIDAFLATLRHTLQGALRRDVPGMSGLRVEFLNSRDHPDPGPGVNRLVIAGTAEEIGEDGFIGQASSVDVGNFRQDDIAYVLLDARSATPDNPNSLNQFAVAAPRTKAELVGHGMATVAAHEAGHFFGLHHTENDNAVRNVQDAGPGTLWHVLDVGSDGVFGAGDGDDVRFRRDVYERTHPFTGTLHAADALAHSLHTAAPAVVAAPPAPTGGATGAPAPSGPASADAVLREAGFSTGSRRNIPPGASARVVTRETFDRDVSTAPSADGSGLRMAGGVGVMTAPTGRHYFVASTQTGADLVLRVDVRAVTDCAGAGLTFHRNERGLGVAELDYLDRTGAARVRVRDTDGRRWTDVSDWQPANGAADGWDTLEVLVLDGVVRTYVNGGWTATGELSPSGGGPYGSGLFVGGCADGPSTYEFDNLTIVDLSGGGGLRSVPGAAPRGLGLDAGESIARLQEAPAPDVAVGEVAVRGVPGGHPAARGYVYVFGATRVRLTEGDGAPRLWVLAPGAEIWREARRGEVAALLDGPKAPAVSTTTPLGGAETEAALERLRALSGMD